jgi:hypothetical protein
LIEVAAALGLVALGISLLVLDAPSACPPSTAWRSERPRLAAVRTLGSKGAEGRAVLRSGPGVSFEEIE